MAYKVQGPDGLSHRGTSQTDTVSDGVGGVTSLGPRLLRAPSLGGT